MNSETRVLVVDDESGLRRFLQRELSSRGMDVDAAATGEEGVLMARAKEYEVVLLDVRLPGIDGIEVLRALRLLEPSPEVLMLTGQGTVNSAVEAMRLGAFHYISKPFHLDGLEVHIHKARAQRELARQNRAFERILAGEFHDLIGESEALGRVKDLIAKVAPSETSVVIEGESGTGKELVARAIHASSPLARRPFVVVNCGALQESLLESELFGHEKGAFTGAVATREGLVEAADGGTLFLDEVGELGLPLQTKLLRFLESGELRRIGSNRTRRVNVRVIAATNRQLAEEVKEGRFRQDLFYRLRVFAIDVPPLRDRPEDVDALIQHFLRTLGSMRRYAFRLDDQVMSAMRQYRWPGNVRELRNAVERMMLLADAGRISASCLPPEIAGAPAPTAPSAASATAGDDLDLARMERLFIERALVQENGVKKAAAERLGISLRTLYNRLAAYSANGAPDA